MSLSVMCDDVFRASLPLGGARLVYADPPYTMEDQHGYGCWPGSRKLVKRMLALGADDCAYVLHCGEWNLGGLLPVIEQLAPKRPQWFKGQPKYRVLPWVKPWRRGWNRNTTVPFSRMWEPVVLWYGSRYKHPRGLTEADWICALRNERSLNGHATQKPDEVLAWLFDRLLAGAQGRLAIDLFAGTGGAAILADRMGLDAIAVERDRFFAEKIVENAAQEPEPRYLPSVKVNGHGRPDWTTLGRLDEELASEAQRVREALHDDPTVSDADYGRLVEEADEADERASWAAEAEVGS